MILNAEQLLEQGLLNLDNAKGKPAQVGYDLSVKEINKVGGTIGKVLVDKTELNTHTPVEKKNLDGRNGWLLYAGVYDVIMNEGCNIPSNRFALEMSVGESMLHDLREYCILHS